jgi:Mrp family chromosome partitioning ATPase
MRVVSFVTQKGGSGKSTTAASIAVAAFQQGRRVFMLELDRQGTLSTGQTPDRLGMAGVRADRRHRPRQGARHAEGGGLRPRRGRYARRGQSGDRGRDARG